MPPYTSLISAFVRRAAPGPRMATTADNHWTRVQPGAHVLPYYVYNRPIKKPDNDERQYRIIRLDNGLQATLIHDPDTDKAAASLDVAVGHLSDPVCPPSK
jgi:insulysin